MWLRRFLACCSSRGLDSADGSCGYFSEIFASSPCRKLLPEKQLASAEGTSREIPKTLSRSILTLIRSYVYFMFYRLNTVSLLFDNPIQGAGAGAGAPPGEVSSASPESEANCVKTY